jgi:microcompartment protein CcmL/EutN
VYAGTVQPGRFLVLIGGAVAEVEEALKAGKETAPDALLDVVCLPGVHADVVRALAGGRAPKTEDALGIIETQTVAAAIQAADKGVKGAQVNLMEIRLADGLHGKGLVFFTGLVADVEAALELADGVLESHQKVRQVVISQLHPEFGELIRSDTRFGVQIGWGE